MRVDEALRTISRTIGTTIPNGFDPLEVLNDAGEWFWGSHEWNFAIRQAFIDVRAQISFSALTYTAATKTISGGSFSSYTWIAGDQLEITAGGQVGWYEVVSATSSTLVLDRSLSSTDIAAGVSGTLHLWGCALPSDLQAILPGTPTIAPGFAQGFDITDLSEVQQWRALFTGGSTASYIGALAWGKNVNGGARVPRLEIAPEIVAGRSGAFVLAYRSKWTRVSSATIEFELPAYANTAFKECLRIFARGYDEEDVATLTDRIEPFKNSELYNGVVDEDALVAPTWGQIKGGAVRTAASRGPFNNFDILDPS